MKDSLLEIYDKVKPKCKTPLYYMGGKTKAIRSILPYIPKDISLLVSPFIGGGSLEVQVASLGIKVIGYDVNRSLVIFWKELLNDPDWLADEIEKIGIVTKEKYWSLFESLDELTGIARAATYFALNRSSFMAQIGVGLSTNPKNNLTSNLIKRIREFTCPNLKVYKKDFAQSIAKHKDDFLYLDPPYFVSNKTKYYSHTDFNHTALRQSLELCDKWILSYDNCEEVRELYTGYRQVPLKWLYSDRWHGSYIPEEAKELLILGDGIK